MIRVVSWNVKYGERVDEAITEIRANTLLAEFDVLLLQEMDPVGTRHLASALDAEHAYSTLGPHRNTGRDFGNAVVSRWPIVSTGKIVLPHVARFRGHPRQATWAELRVRERSITACSVHGEVALLPLKRRVEQFSAVADSLYKPSAAPLIVRGDFNTITARGVEAVAGTLAHRGLDHATAELPGSLRRRLVSLRLDHDFSSGFEVVDASVVESTAASDHLPVVCSLRFAG